MRRDPVHQPFRRGSAAQHAAMADQPVHHLVEDLEFLLGLVARQRVLAAQFPGDPAQQHLARLGSLPKANIWFRAMKVSGANLAACALPSAKWPGTPSAAPKLNGNQQILGINSPN